MADNLITWLIDYRPIAYYVYGLVFFTLGMTITLQSRHYSRLTLAKSLPWLGAFGISHAFYEWGEVFIPLQIESEGPQLATVLTIIQIILLAISFSALFQFGIEMLRPFSPRWRWIRLVPFAVFILWLVGPFMIGFSLIPDLYKWDAFATANAHYFICAPGSLFSVIGLIHQQRAQIKPMKLPHIDNVIRVAAGSLAAYGVLSGLIVPKTFFFPATIINHETFASVMFFPPYVYRSIAGVLLLVSIARSLEIFNIETDVMIRNMEEVQVVAYERERIARDLHDGALQQVYAAGLLAQSLKRHISTDRQKEVDRLIDTINQAIDQLREFLPKPQPDIKFVDLIGAISPKIDEAKRYTRIDTTWDITEIPALSVEQTRHVTALLSEAISNAIRHSKSEKIKISISYQNSHLVMEIRDFGKGISPSAEQGFGLKNMRDRAKLLGAEFSIESEDAKGTTVKLDMPLGVGTNEH